MSPHAIGDNEEAPLLVGVGVKAVFVACPYASDIRAGGDRKLHVFGVARLRK